MSTRYKLIARMIAAWLLAAIVACLVVYRFPYPAFGFFAMVMIGLCVCYLVVDDEMKLKETPDPRERERNRGVGYQPPLPIEALRFLYPFGVGLMIIGVGGGLYYLLRWVLS